MLRRKPLQRKNNADVVPESATAATVIGSQGKIRDGPDGLKAARSHLLTGRRNVIGWRLFYALAAQYHADRLALSYIELHRSRFYSNAESRRA